MCVILAVTPSWARDKRWSTCVLVVGVGIRGLRFFRGVRIALCESMDAFALVCFEIYPFFVLSRSAPFFWAFAASFDAPSMFCTQRNPCRYSPNLSPPPVLMCTCNNRSVNQYLKLLADNPEKVWLSDLGPLTAEPGKSSHPSPGWRCSPYD